MKPNVSAAGLYQIKMPLVKADLGFYYESAIQSFPCADRSQCDRDVLSPGSWICAFQSAERLCRVPGLWDALACLLCDPTAPLLTVRQ